MRRDNRSTPSTAALDTAPTKAAVAPGKRARTDGLSAPVQRKHADSAENSDDVHQAADLGISGPSGSLPHLDAIQRSFGKHDVQGVQAHTDGNAVQGAAAMGAEAFTTGNHVAFAGAPSLHTAAHEAAHAVQQRAGVVLAGGVGQVGDSHEAHADAVADRVVQGQSSEDLLDGYAGAGAGSATPATQRLVQRQATEVQRIIGEKATKAADVYVQELYSYLQSLGDAQVGTTLAGLSYGEVVEVVQELQPDHGDSATYRTILLALLASGDFQRCNKALQVLTACGPVQQETTLQAADTAGLGQHAMWLYVDLVLQVVSAPVQRAVLTRIAQQVADHDGLFDTVKSLPLATRQAICDPYMTAIGDIAKLKACFYGRYKVKAEDVQAASYSPKKKEFNVAGLRRIYQVLSSLPEEHVAGNASLARIGRYEDGAGISGYQSAIGGGEVGLGYADDKMDQTNDSTHGGLFGLGATKDPLHGVDRFNKVVRHEIGHAVDQNIDASGTYCTSDAGGGWHDYSNNYAQVATDLIQFSNGFINALEPTKHLLVHSAMMKMMELRLTTTRDLETRITTLASGASVTFSKSELKSIVQDSAVKALLDGLKQPWWNFTGVDLGAHRFQESYEGNWTRYKHATRARQVSNYQFRAPGEWFAEAYAAYYEPTTDPSHARGYKLQQIDAFTWAWFNTNVHDRITTPRP